jgi:hypothetical protein
MIVLGQCTASLIRIVEAPGGAQECRAATHASRLTLTQLQAYAWRTPKVILEPDLRPRCTPVIATSSLELRGGNQLFELTGSTQVSCPFVE